MHVLQEDAEGMSQTKFMVSRFPCGCVNSIMVLDKDTTPADLARWWAGIAKSKHKQTAGEEPVKPVFSCAKRIAGEMCEFTAMLEGKRAKKLRAEKRAAKKAGKS